MKRCCQKFGEECKDAMVIEGEEVLTLRPEERGTHKVFRNTDKILRKWSLMDVN